MPIRSRVFVPLLLVAVALGATAWTAPARKPSLAAALKNLKIPPDWFKGVTVNYDLKKPWSEGRLEVRRLFTEDRPREAVKLTYLYRQKGDQGNGHELPWYLFMGGELAWSLKAHEEFLQRNPGIPSTSQTLASCYTYFGEYGKALKTLDTAMDHLNDIADPGFRGMVLAGLNDAYGDVYADKGDVGKAKQYYQKAVELYPLAKPPYGRHLLPRRAAKVQAKLDLLTLKTLDVGALRDGRHSGQGIGYAGDKLVNVDVTIKGGRIAQCAVTSHEEKIDLDAVTIIPQRIVAKQTPVVDGITGATITCQAIQQAALEALRKAGLK